jgi:SAM-dependent methyltransferase
VAASQIGQIAYDDIGHVYAQYRRPDPRIQAQLWAALADAPTVVDIGAGTGSYEPLDRPVIAVEPSAVMIGQRPPDSAPSVRAFAQSLPFATNAFGAAMAVLCVHHFPDVAAGLAEMRRVAPRLAILTFEPAIHNRFWLVDEYIPAAAQLEASRAPSVDFVADAIGATQVDVVPIPHDCEDGFGWAYWRRPEMYLDPSARQCISMLAQLRAADVQPGIDRLREDLRTGAWHRRHADLLELDTIDGGYRLVVTKP